MTDGEKIQQMQSRIEELNQKVEELEEQIQNMSIPIIPSILPNTILVPFVGDLYPERFNNASPQILTHVSEHVTDIAILDFTAISLQQAVSLDILGEHINSLARSLNLMGTEVVIVGLGPQLTRALVTSGMDIIQNINCFLDFKTALQYLMKQKGLKFASM